MTLHIFNKSNADQSPLKSMLCALSNADAIILIEDGVYLAQEALFEQFAGYDNAIYALDPDIQARGLQERLSDKVKPVDDNGFVTLCCEHDKTVSWF